MEIGIDSLPSLCMEATVSAVWMLWSNYCTWIFYWSISWRWNASFPSIDRLVPWGRLQSGFHRQRIGGSNLCAPI